MPSPNQRPSADRPDHARHRRTPASQPPRAPALPLLWLLPLLLLTAPLTAAPAASPAAAAGDTATPPAAQWLQTYAARARAAPASCAPAQIPALSDTIPARAFVLGHPPAPAAGEPLIAVLKDAIAERFIVLAEDARGCVHVRVSGRLADFGQRSIGSPFPNARLPRSLGATPAVAIVADHKSIRPWIELVPEQEFQRRTDRTWIAIGGFTGMLATLFIVALLLVSYQRSAIAVAYLFYTSALLLYQIQALGLGFAWLPSWPPQWNPILQGLAAGTVVIGIALPVLAFLRPRPPLRGVLIGGFLLSASGLYLSVFDVQLYRAGAAVMPLLALLVLILLARRLRDGDLAMRWFALGLAASLAGAGTQAAALVVEGAGLPALAAFGFPIGNVVESFCWLFAVLTRLASENRDLQQRLLHDASHDPLTGSFNRSHLRGRLSDALSRTLANPRRRRGLLYIDIDGFRRINERYGQAIGDRVLRGFATALEGLDLKADVIGRFGGDEFMVLMPDQAHSGHTEGAAATILGRCRDPILAEGHPVKVCPSIGMLEIDHRYSDVDDLIQDASEALKTAKALGGGHAVSFKPHMRAAARAHNQLRVGLEKALRAHQLELHYQPVVELGGQTPLGYEALLRWRHDQDAIHTVDEVLAVAADAGLLVPTGQRVLDLALAQIAAWQQAGQWDVGQYVSINVCAAQLVDGTLVEHLHSALHRHGIDAAAVRLEIADQSLGTDLDWARQVLPRLLGQHVLLGIGDLGAGLSSLTMLTELQPDYIKLDPAITAGLPHLPRAQSLANAARLLASELGCLAIANGIENPEQLQVVTDLGFAHGQGRLLAAPMTAAETGAWMQATRDPSRRPCSRGEPRLLH